MAINDKRNQVAIARENGDVEIWTCAKSWHMERVVRGAASVKLTALLWTPEGRLFGTALNGCLFELDLHRLIAKNHCDSFGGAIWSIAGHFSTETIVVGCEDGRIRMYSYAHDSLEYVKTFMGTGCRIVSLGWHSEGKILFSGNAEGLIHRWDVESGRSTSRITMETMRSDKSIVWSVAVLDDFTVISGDSLGHVQVWDGHSCTLLHTFSQLTAEVLTLAINKGQSKVFAAGLDGQVALFEKTQTKWVYRYIHRSHSHDVRALAIVSPVDQEPEILLSGGMDTQLVYYPTETFATTRPMKLGPFPHREIVTICAKKRMLLVQKTTSLELWYIAKDESETNTLALQMNLKGDYNITCASISPDGQFIAVSTSQQVKVFRIEYNDEDHSVRPEKIELPRKLTQAANILSFGAESQTLIVGTQAGEIKLIDLTKQTLSRVFEQHVQDQEPISALAVSSDGQWLVSTDLANNVLVFNIDSLQYFGRLPSPETKITAIGFNSSARTLIAATLGGRCITYDIEAKQIVKIASLNDSSSVFKGVSFDPSRANMVVVYNQTVFASLTIGQSAGPVPKKRKITQEVQLVKEYRPLLHLGYLGSHEMVVVETPWLNILQKLPDVLYRRPYGA